MYGKIRGISKPDTTITFTYNPAGQRTSKGTGRTTTYYVRDGQGNTMGVYQTQKFGTLWTEQHLYGSSRIGMWIPGVEPNNKTQKYRAFQQGTRTYELDNHLGNVMATVSDQRIPHYLPDSTTIDYYLPTVITAQDYYAFGGLQEGRTYLNAIQPYRYGFNGKENDNDVKGEGNQQDYGMRIYDPRMGKFLSVDPIGKDYPELTSYQFASDNPIEFIDVDGLEKGKAQGQENPYTYFKSVMDNLQAGIREEYHSLEAAALRADAKNESLKPLNKAIAAAMKNPIQADKNLSKIVRKQIDAAVNDGLTFLNLTANGQNKKASAFLGKKLAEYGPMFLIPGEQELEPFEGEIFAVRPQEVTAIGSSEGQWKTLRDAGQLSEFRVLKIDDRKVANFDFTKAADRELFWNTYNKPFLDEAIRKGQSFKLIDVPTVEMIYPGGDVSKGFNFYGRELEYLEKNGYELKNNMMVPKTNK